MTQRGMTLHNTQLEKLLKNEFLNDKDRYEIRQIFMIVDEKKKIHILVNFDKILNALRQIKAEMREQQEILLGKAISNIELAIKNARLSAVKNATSSSIQNLKYKI